MGRRTLPTVLLVTLAWLRGAPAWAADAPRPGEFGRPESIAKHGMVASTHPQAVRIGVEVLKNGGNAIDAAIATNAAMGLMEPMSCGVGGDLYAIVWDAKTKKLYGLNASGRAPYAATIDAFRQKKLAHIPTTGALSWSVPGCVDGWDQLQKKFGTKSLAELLEPSIKFAEEGFEVPETIAGYWRGAEHVLVESEPAAETYLVNGRAPAKGATFKNPRLARTYREIARNGRDAFYKGRIAEEIVRYSQQAGGLFAMRDFETHSSTWVEPVSTNYRGYDVWEIPPPGQGISVLQMLNILEGYDLKSMGVGSADYWHVMLEAKKLAYADRARFYADPEFAKVPVAGLISKEYAAERRKTIDMNIAADALEPGNPKLGGDTIYLCTVDKDGNCVSLIQSNYFGFGSGLVPGGLGFALQNRGTLFSLDPNHPNHLEPHKRPFHTIIPAMVTKEGKPWFVFGVMGGDMQPQGHVQVLCNLIDFGMNVQQAGEYPRLEHIGSATPTGHLARGSGTVIAEGRIPAKVIKELEKRGHDVERGKNGGGYQGILIDPATGLLHGGTEARRDGMAEGY